MSERLTARQQKLIDWLARCEWATVKLAEKDHGKRTVLTCEHAGLVERFQGLTPIIGGGRVERIRLTRKGRDATTVLT